jgi:hypothetical protein
MAEFFAKIFEAVLTTDRRGMWWLLDGRKMRLINRAIVRTRSGGTGLMIFLLEG